MSDYSESEQGEIEADLTEMYKAGRVELPKRAEALAATGTSMSSCIDQANAAAAQLGDHPVCIDLLSLMVECQVGVSRSVETLNNIATAVVAVADDFVARDEYAATVFNGLNPELTEGGVPVTPTPTPPREDDVLAPGAGEEHPPNPDPADPETERERREREFQDEQDAVPEPVS